MEPYQVRSSKFLGREGDNYTYEITLNQSLVHTGRLTGIEDGLNKYREEEISQHEEEILQQADRIRSQRQAI